MKSPDQDFMFPTIRKEKVFKDCLPECKEVLGPVSDVPGHPMTVVFGGLFGIGIAVDRPMLKAKGVTMLYRRFRAEQLSNDGNDAATLHTLQLLPTYTQGEFCVFVQSLAGLSMKVNSPKEIPSLFSLLHTYATTLKLLRE